VGYQLVLHLHVQSSVWIRCASATMLVTNDGQNVNMVDHLELGRFRLLHSGVLVFFLYQS
jgi:hypothetical protein